MVHNARPRGSKSDWPGDATVRAATGAHRVTVRAAENHKSIELIGPRGGVGHRQLDRSSGVCARGDRISIVIENVPDFIRRTQHEHFVQVHLDVRLQVPVVHGYVRAARFIAVGANKDFGSDGAFAWSCDQPAVVVEVARLLPLCEIHALILQVEGR